MLFAYHMWRITVCRGDICLEKWLGAGSFLSLCWFLVATSDVRRLGATNRLGQLTVPFLGIGIVGVDKDVFFDHEQVASLM